MKAFINAKYQKNSLDILNEMRKLIKVFSLLNITNSQGNLITLHA